MASTDIVDKIANVCQKWKTMLDEMSEKQRVCAEENRILKLELALAKDRTRSRSPRCDEIIADNTACRRAEALGYVGKHTVYRSQIDDDLKREIVNLKAEVRRLEGVEANQAHEISDLLKGNGRIADVFLTNWEGEHEEDSEEDPEVSEEDRMESKMIERNRLDHRFQGTTVRQFLASVDERLRDLSAHINGHFSH